MTTIAGVSGSLREGSINTALLRAIAALAPAGTTGDTATIKGIPLSTPTRRRPTAFRRRWPRSRTGLPPLTACCWSPRSTTTRCRGCSRMPSMAVASPGDSPRTFANRPVAVVGASPGGFGTLLAQTAWLPVLRTREPGPVRPRLAVSRAGGVFDAQGNLVDDKVREQVAAFIAASRSSSSAGMTHSPTWNAYMNSPCATASTAICTTSVDGIIVRRILPSPERLAVGPFVFMDHLGPAELPATKASTSGPTAHRLSDAHSICGKDGSSTVMDSAPGN